MRIRIQLVTEWKKECMTVAELINELKTFPQSMQLTVKHRDSGGEYDGCTTDLYLLLSKEFDYETSKEEWVILL